MVQTRGDGREGERQHGEQQMSGASRTRRGGIRAIRTWRGGSGAGDSSVSVLMPLLGFPSEASGELVPPSTWHCSSLKVWGRTMQTGEGQCPGGRDRERRSKQSWDGVGTFELALTPWANPPGEPHPGTSSVMRSSPAQGCPLRNQRLLQWELGRNLSPHRGQVMTLRETTFLLRNYLTFQSLVLLHNRDQKYS